MTIDLIREFGRIPADAVLEAINTVIREVNERIQVLAEGEVAASGDVLEYNTKAAADAALTGLPDLKYVEVLADESRKNARTLYRKEAGSYVYKMTVSPPYIAPIPSGSNGGNMFMGIDTGNTTLAWDGVNSYTASNNFGYGVRCLQSLTTGYWNYAFGYQNLQYCTSGSGNVAVGGNALENLTLGFDNIAMGDDAGLHCTTSSCNVFLGHYAGDALVSSGAFSVTNGKNVFVGLAANCDASISTTCSNSTALGAGATVTKSNQMVFGTGITEYSFNSSANILLNGTAYLNKAGAQARVYVDGTDANDAALIAGGSGDCYFGNWGGTRGYQYNASGNYRTLGSGNMAIGAAPTADKLHVQGSLRTTGTASLASVGGQCRLVTDASTANDGALLATVAGGVYLANWDITRGIQVHPSTGNVSIGVFRPSTDNNRTLGTASFRWSEVYAGNATINTSDARLKKDVENSALGLSFIEKLRPVSFRWKEANGTVEWDDEEYEVEVEYPVTEDCEITDEVTEITDGKAIRRIVRRTEPRHIIDCFPLFEEDGSPVMEQYGKADDQGVFPTRQKMHHVQRMAVRTEKRIRRVERSVPRAGKRKHFGLIAQEVRQVLLDAGQDDFAGWVLSNVDDPDSTQSLRYEHFIAPLISAVQELAEIVSDLENRI